MCGLCVPLRWKYLERLREPLVSTRSTTKKTAKIDHIIDLHVLPIARRNVQDANPDVP